MAGELKDYLSATTADYSTTQFDVTPQEVMTEEGEFRQKTVEFDDVSVGVLTKSTTPIFLFSLRWPVLTEVDANTIYDFYFDTAKAKGRARTFEFPHPTDGNTYIVRFWSTMSRETRYLRSINEIKLRVEGYKA
jgi:hypothetical protein